MDKVAYWLGPWFGDRGIPKLIQILINIIKPFVKGLFD